MYAIKNTKTNKWVYGTDYRYTPPRQRTTVDKALTFTSEEEATHEFEYRCCGKAYKIVKVEIIEVAE